MDYTAVGVHDFYTFLLVFSRIGGLIITAPLISGRMVPQTFKAGFALILSLSITPMIAPKVGAIPPHLLLLAAYVIKNAVFGMAVGFLSRVLFSSVEMGGYFIDTQMGLGFMNLFNPFAEHPQSILSVFQYQLATTVYLLANGHLLLLSGIVESFNALPPGEVMLSGSSAMIMVTVLKAMFVLGFRLALPVAGVLMVIDVAFGLIARFVPQINIFIVGTPAKIIVGLATVALLMPVMALVVGQIVGGTAAGMHALIAASK